MVPGQGQGRRTNGDSIGPKVETARVSARPSGVKVLAPGEHAVSRVGAVHFVVVGSQSRLKKGQK